MNTLRPILVLGWKTCKKSETDIKKGQAMERRFPN